MSDMVKLLTLGASLVAIYVIAVSIVPFLVALGLKWMAFVAMKTGVDPQLLSICCFLAGISTNGKKKD